MLTDEDVYRAVILGWMGLAGTAGLAVWFAKKVRKQH